MTSSRHPVLPGHVAAQLPLLLHPWIHQQGWKVSKKRVVSGGTGMSELELQPLVAPSS